MRSKTKMEQYELTKFPQNCTACGCEITSQHRFSNLPCEDYCCKCCPNAKELPCPKEKEYGTILDHFNENTRTQILKAIERKGIFIGYMMLCRYLNNRGYIRYGCNAGYPDDNKHGNAKIDPCPILCPNSTHTIGKVRYHTQKLAKEGKVHISTRKFYDSKNPYSRTSPKKLDLFTFICKSEDFLSNYLKKNTLRGWL